MAYSQENLDRRTGVIDGQKRLIEFLDADKFNRLVHLFDEKVDNNADGEKHIIKFIQKERQSRGLSEDGVTMYSMVYGEHANNSTLHVTIVKDTIDYLHLSIHLSPIKLIPKAQGLKIFILIYLNLQNRRRDHCIHLYISNNRHINQIHSIFFEQMEIVQMLINQREIMMRI